ncbi:MAG: 3-phosphoshikimate 1-carboxyvinyltransferase, partial [Legionellaceae bacterium]|nr:3-phosphoshikimate 1-carboxyvinyltransferase [Legionellaceae bacterium]
MTDELESYPVSLLQGELCLPGDKSISHRALMLAALCQDPMLLQGVSQSQDCTATRIALEAMGVPVREETVGELWIEGGGLRGLQPPTHRLDCGNSGTSMRLFMGLLSAQFFSTSLSGDASLRKRPMDRVAIPLRQMGAQVRLQPEEVQIEPVTHLQGGHFDLPMASSQVKSALLLAGLYAKGRTSIKEPLQTRDHTERLFQWLGVPCVRRGLICTLSPLEKIRGKALSIPGDFSSAAFFIVAACIIPGSYVYFRGVGVNATRLGLIAMLRRMGASIEIMAERMLGFEPVADIRVRYCALQGIVIPTAVVPSM